MKQMLHKRLSCYIFLTLLFFWVFVRSAAADQENPRTLKVAFPQVAGYSETDEEGNRHGLVVDYLNEIAKYTGWEYEYVDTDGENLMKDFEAGKFDLLGGTYYMPGLEEVFSYPDYSTGHTKSVLLARWDDETIGGYDINDLNGKTIGVYERAKENTRRLEEFLSMNGLDCTIRYYKNEQLEEGKLFSYLESGEIDLLLGNTGDDTGRFRAAAYFEAQAHYIVTTPDNKEVLDGLNWALGKIMESTPDFAQDRYEANFPNNGGTKMFLSQEEREYAKGKDMIKVAVPYIYHPFFCLSDSEQSHNGLVPDLLKKVEEFSGLEFTYVYADSYVDCLELVKQGEADMAGFFLGTEADAVQQDLSLTQPYATISDVVVRNKSVSFPGKGLTCAVLEGRHLPPDIDAAEVKYYKDMTQALVDINQGRIDFAYGLSSRLELEMQQNYLPNIVPVTLIDHSNDISFVLPKPADPNLLTILNKTLSNLTEEELSAITNPSLISVSASSLKLSDLLYTNPVLCITIVAAILLLVVAVIAVIAHARIKGAMMRAELEKAEADSRAKSQFLSRMSHEIRTPMNAIVGLTDLTGMAKGLPEDVQSKLVKLRSSSKYLLSLLNDILDMSRIDGGMLEIAREPFSLPKMIDELASMMGSEAERRGLKLTVETKIFHPGLTGDEVRLRQVLTNLLSNAIKFTPAKGCVELQVLETKSDQEGATFFFSVKDNGIGITNEDRERIFWAFEQAGVNHVRSEGTGLGLPISRSIVGLMGGELEVDSELGKGSEFYFTVTLPFGVPQWTAGHINKEQLDGSRLLLVEDNDLNAEIAAELLETQGAIVTRASDGRQALELFKASSPGEFQAILMDVQMPVMNGLEATRAIRRLGRPDAAAIPIMAMTANSFQDDIDAAIAAGMNAFVPKPLDVAYLYSKLAELLNRQGS